MKQATATHNIISSANNKTNGAGRPSVTGLSVTGLSCRGIVSTDLGGLLKQPLAVLLSLLVDHRHHLVAGDLLDDVDRVRRTHVLLELRGHLARQRVPLHRNRLLHQTAVTQIAPNTAAAAAAAIAVGWVGWPRGVKKKKKHWMLLEHT